MASSYKICVVNDFNRGDITSKKLAFGGQIGMEGIPSDPRTEIYVSPDKITLGDFERFTIEHELEERAVGRVGIQTFQRFIRQAKLDAYQSTSLKLLLLSGKKKDVLDFCRKHAESKIVRFQTTEIDMRKLLSLLPSVKGAWFGFASGQLNASALMGQNLQDTPDFKKFQAHGELTNLSFFHLFKGESHPVTVTDDGAIALQAKYTTRTEEIELALDIKARLLDKLITVKDKKGSKRPSETVGVGGKRS